MFRALPPRALELRQHIRSPAAICRLLVFTHPVPVSKYRAEPRIAAQLVLIAVEKVPVKTVEGAAIGPGLVLHIIAAITAIIGHAVDIGAARRIGFRSQKSAIGKLRHADHIGGFDPFIGIGVHGEIPFVQFKWIDAGQKRKCPGDHEAVDMVGIAMLQRLADGFATALPNRDTFSLSLAAAAGIDSNDKLKKFLDPNYEPEPVKEPEPEADAESSTDEEELDLDLDLDDGASPPLTSRPPHLHPHTIMVVDIGDPPPMTLFPPVSPLLMKARAERSSHEGTIL